MPDIANTPLFPLGHTVATPGALSALGEEGIAAAAILTRHACGDWGNLGDEDKSANDFAVTRGSRILSAYLLPRTRIKLWVITEADRSVTTLLLPDEY